LVCECSVASELQGGGEKIIEWQNRRRKILVNGKGQGPGGNVSGASPRSLKKNWPVLWWAQGSNSNQTKEVLKRRRITHRAEPKY